jgi:two-component system, sensor histidine kinase PdtaS
MFVDLLKRLRVLRGIPLWVRYAATAILVLACFALRYLVGALDEPGHLPLFLMFVPAVIVASFLFDRGSGFFAVGLSSVVGVYFYVEPAGTFEFQHTGEVIRLVSFILIGLLTASIIEALRQTVDELSERTDELVVARTELTASNQHRDLLLADINHRIKNHLTSVAGTLAMDRQALVDERAQAALDAAIARLSVLGRVYTRLHVSGSQVEVDADAFLEELCSDLRSTVVGLRPVALSCSFDRIKMDAQQAVTLGLLVNELVTNAIKYAFEEGQIGEVTVSLAETADGYALEVRDTGRGLVAEMQGGGTGTKLVRALVGQMRGTVDWKNDGGAVVTIRIPKQAPS